MLTLVVTTLLTLVAIGPAGATDVIQVLNNPDEFAGREIQVTGELVGDFGRHSGAYWVQLNDDSYATAPLLETGQLTGGNVGIALRIPPGLFDAIASNEQPGGYRWRGPIVAVTGEFRYHDPDRSGETYVAVVSIQLVEPGYPLPSEATGPWGVIGMTLAFAAAVVLAQHARNRRRERRLEE